jgi:Methylmalonic aciduria and homocystinuria type D protein
LAAGQCVRKNAITTAVICHWIHVSLVGETLLFMVAQEGAASYGQTQSTVWGPFEIQSRRCKKSAGADSTTDASALCSTDEPHGSAAVLEVSIHAPLPKPLQREVRHVFGILLDDITTTTITTQDDICVAIPTNQKAVVDLVSMRGEAVEAEKDRLLNVFMEFAATLCQEISALHYWADYIDPCSGLPMLTRHANKVYSEVDGMECCLGYRSYSAGFCKVLEHPIWGTAVYPATIFSNAPNEVVIRILEQYRKNNETTNVPL